MALIKEVLLDTGVTVSYHKIAVVNVNYHLVIGWVVVYSFVDKDTQLEGMKPVQEQVIDLPASLITASPSGVMLPEAYAYIKQLEFFTGSIDDI
jgi:hypothetical protein